MKFIVASIIFAGMACAKLALTNSDYSGIEAGEPFEITWAGALGPVSIILKAGPEGDLVDVAPIASGLSGESFSWTPSGSLDPSTKYALAITDGTDINYSKQFNVEGGTATPSSSSVISTVTSTSAVSSTTVVSSTVSSTVSTTVSTTVSATVSSTTASVSSTSATSSSETASFTSSAESTSSTTSSASSTRTVTSAVRTSTSTATETTVPGTNNAQGVVAPLVAPLLMAVGVALF